MGSTTSGVGSVTVDDDTFSDLGACLENVEYLPDRGLKQEELLWFGTCNYIQEHHNIILLGATGSGKTVLCREVHPAPGSAGGVPDRQG